METKQNTTNVYVQCHICKEWHLLTEDEIALYVDTEHADLLWTCPECQV